MANMLDEIKANLIYYRTHGYEDRAHELELLIEYVEANEAARGRYPYTPEMSQRIQAARRALGLGSATGGGG